MNVHRHYTWLKVAYYTIFTSDPEEPSMASIISGIYGITEAGSVQSEISEKSSLIKLLILSEFSL